MDNNRIVDVSKLSRIVTLVSVVIPLIIAIFVGVNSNEEFLIWAIITLTSFWLASYIFEKGLDEHGSEIRLTKTEQTRMVGNSVCPQLSRALVEANFKHESKYRGAA